MSEQMGEESREVEILRKSQKEKLCIKTIITEMVKALDRFTGLPNTAEERTSELEGISIET